MEHKGPWDKAYLHTKWHLDVSSRFTAIEMAENWGGALPTFCGGWLGPHLTQKSPGLKLTSIPSGTLMHPAVWPQ